MLCPVIYSLWFDHVNAHFLLGLLVFQRWPTRGLVLVLEQRHHQYDCFQLSPRSSPVDTHAPRSCPHLHFSGTGWNRPPPPSAPSLLTRRIIDSAARRLNHGAVHQTAFFFFKDEARGGMGTQTGGRLISSSRKSKFQVKFTAGKLASAAVSLHFSFAPPPDVWPRAYPTKEK